MSASLTAEQKSQVAQWVAEGASLSEVQKRLAAEFNLSLTYMDTRFLVDDLDLALKEKPAPVSADLSKSTPPPSPENVPSPFPGPEDVAPGAGKVRVAVDKVVRPGAVVSGNVTFSDGQTADWYLDQAGRLGLVPKTKGYKPSAPDVQEFQYVLQDELARMGY
ncbi:MAG TPA: hypothetical protein VHC95_02745 [Opitutales bacterium]|nr:hypothetical protein [Opitutales bacterium]